MSDASERQLFSACEIKDAGEYTTFNVTTPTALTIKLEVHRVGILKAHGAIQGYPLDRFLNGINSVVESACPTVDGLSAEGDIDFTEVVRRTPHSVEVNDVDGPVTFPLTAAELGATSEEDIVFFMLTNTPAGTFHYRPQDEKPIIGLEIENTNPVRDRAFDMLLSTCLPAYRNDRPFTLGQLAGQLLSDKYPD